MHSSAVRVSASWTEVAEDVAAEDEAAEDVAAEDEAAEDKEDLR
jgi:hypothetical protein